MHYTTWDRSDRENPVLLAEEGPERLAVFHTATGTAEVGQSVWSLTVDATSATAALGDISAELSGRRSRDKRLVARVAQREYAFINEASSDWVIVAANQAGEGGEMKVAQFSGKNSGVRKAIVEFEGEATVAREDIVALSWFARLILEDKMSSSSVVIIATLVLASIVAVSAFLL